MNFYDLNYISQQNNINDYIKFGIIFLALGLTIIIFILYRRNQFQTKYRDLSRFCCKVLNKE